MNSTVTTWLVVGAIGLAVLLLVSKRTRALILVFGLAGAGLGIWSRFGGAA